MDRYLSTLVLTFCVALGVNLGGSLLGSLGALITRRPPLHTMMELSAELKIWALVTAIGGTFDAITAIEKGFFGEYYGEMVKHFLYIASAFLGAHSASLLIYWMIGDTQ